MTCSLNMKDTNFTQYLEQLEYVLNDLENITNENKEKYSCIFFINFRFYFKKRKRKI